MNTSDILGLTGNLTAGTAITQDANGRFPLVQATQVGGTIPVSTINLATVSNITTAYNASVSSTYWTASGGSPTNYYNQYNRPFITTAGNLLYVSTNNASNAGLSIYLRTADGKTTVTSSVIEPTANGIYYFSYCQLSNGNIAVAYGDATNARVRIAIYTPQLSQVLAPTTIQTAAVNTYAPLWITALTGGGFALLWSNVTTACYIAAYNNTGTATLAPTSIASSFYNTQYTNYGPTSSIVSLSNGNFAVLFQNSGNTVLTYAVYSNTGTAVVAQTNLTISSYRAAWINAVNGYFAISYVASGTTPTLTVFNNAGTQQGTSYTWGSVTAQVQNGLRGLTNDGTNFWVFATDSTASVIRAVLIPTTGAANSIAYSNSSQYTSVGGSNSVYMDFAIANNAIGVMSANLSTAQPYAAVFSALDFSVIISSTNIYNGTPSSNGSNFPSVTNLGDGAMVFNSFFDTANVFNVYKVQNTSIQGVATSTATSGGVFSVRSFGQTGVGTNAATQTALGTTATFDHTSATIPGIKGAIGTNFAVIKGF